MALFLMNMPMKCFSSPSRFGAPSGMQPRRVFAEAASSSCRVPMGLPLKPGFGSHHNMPKRSREVIIRKAIRHGGQGTVTAVTAAEVQCDGSSGNSRRACSSSSTRRSCIIRLCGTSATVMALPGLPSQSSAVALNGNNDSSTVGMTTEDALMSTLRSRRQLQDAMTQPAAQDDEGAFSGTALTPAALEGLVQDLARALPVVGAEAAYTQDDWRLKLRGTPVDSMVSVFALLDRAADGASEEGPNRTISIRDIERLEMLEALTCQVLDTLEGLKRTGTDDPGSARSLRKALLALDDIIDELPKREVAAAMRKIA